MLHSQQNSDLTIAETRFLWDWLCWDYCSRWW